MYPPGETGCASNLKCLDIQPPIGEHISRSEYAIMNRFGFECHSLAELVKIAKPTPPLPPIIGLGGKRGAGKDAIGRLISIAWGYKRIALADTLKDEYAALNGVPRGDLDNPVTKETHRKGMQALGGLRRSEDVDYWIKQSGMTDTDELIVVTDCRMENERAAIRSLGGLTLWIANDEADAQIDTDPTESATPDEYDFVLYNDKSLPVATAFDAADLLEPLLGGRMSLHAIDAWLDTLPDL